MMLGMGADNVSYQEWLDFGGDPLVPAPAVGAGGGDSFWGSKGATDWLNTLTRGTLAIVGTQFQKPTYETHSTPSGSSTIIRTGGGMNYPVGGPTSVPVAGVSTTTMLMLGVAAMFAVMMMARR